MMGEVFFAARHKYEQNHRDAAALNVKRAVMAAPLNKEEPGIAICILGRPVLVLPTAAALRLATEIANRLTEIRSEH